MLTLSAVRILVLIALVYIDTSIAELAGQTIPHYSHRQLKRVMAHASNVHDFEILSTYFRFEELSSLAKAQKVLDDYNHQSTKYPMATKTVTRSEVMNRSYTENLKKAADSARLAYQYDEMIIKAGGTPPFISSKTVSLDTLQNTSSQTPASAFVKPKNLP